MQKEQISDMESTYRVSHCNCMRVSLKLKSPKIIYMNVIY